VIRATTYRDRDPGKWIADENKPVIPHCGKEVRLKEGTFEFLIVRSAVDPRSGGSAAPPSLDPAYSGAVAGTPVGQTERAKHLLEESLYSWHPAQGADGGIWVPHGALKTSERMFVVRTPEGEVGKFIADEGVAKFPLKGKEITVDKDKFDFLVLGPHTRYEWTPIGLDGSTPPASECVWASSRMAVIRATEHPDRDPGKFIVDEGAAAVGRCNKEIKLRQGEYEFLSVRSSLGGGGGSGGGGSTAEAAHAAMVERGEKLHALGPTTQAMASEAQTFAGLASQLNKTYVAID